MVITKYFHLMASGRKKNNYIFVPLNNGTKILGDEEIIKHATEYYKGLFGKAPVTDLRLEGIEGNQLPANDMDTLTK
jgi:hypothetical protein